MDIHAFVFNWRGHHENACALAAALGRRLRTTVINSDEEAARRHPDWVNLGEEAYFAAQWNAALERFDGDVLFHMQADASCPDLDQVIDRAREVFVAHDAGVYEPNVDYTDILYDRSRLVSLDRDLALIPFSDTTCWFLASSVVRRMPPVDLSLNKYGWGVAATAAALASDRRAPCIRDYRLTIRHPRGRGYPTRMAIEQRVAWIRSLPADLEQRVMDLYRTFGRTLIRACW